MIVSVYVTKQTRRSCTVHPVSFRLEVIPRSVRNAQPGVVDRCLQGSRVLTSFSRSCSHQAQQKHHCQGRDNPLNLHGWVHNLELKCSISISASLSLYPSLQAGWCLEWVPSSSAKATTTICRASTLWNRLYLFRSWREVKEIACVSCLDLTLIFCVTKSSSVSLTCEDHSIRASIFEGEILFLLVHKTTSSFTRFRTLWFSWFLEKLNYPAFG